MEQQRNFDPMTGQPLNGRPVPPPPPRQNSEHGKSEAITSLVLGIVALCFCMTSGLIGLALGITGMIFASQAKKKGYLDGMRTGGFVTSLLAIIFSSISVLIGSILRSIFFALGTGLISEILEEAFLI